MNNSKTIKGNDGLGTTTITQIEDKLTVAQEHMNNAYMAVQGILQAHAEKNNEDKPAKAYLKCNCVNSFDNVFNDVYEEAIRDYMKNAFTFSDFDKSVKRTWKDQDFKDAVSNAALGLTGEAGEVSDLIKKAIYHERMFDFECEEVDEDTIKEYGKPIKKEDVKDELSDILFYVSAMAQEFGFTLEDVARHNKEKLEKRYQEGFTTKESAEKKDKLRVFSDNVEIWQYGVKELTECFNTEEGAQKKDKLEFKSLHTGANVQ